jgi:hypothetical protein
LSLFHDSIVKLKHISIGSDYYSLRDVVFFYENSELSSVDYRKKVLQARITAIVELDRKDLKEYLTGVISICPQIDVIAAASYVPVAPSVTSIAPAAPTSSSSLDTSREQEKVDAAVAVEPRPKKSITFEAAESAQYVITSFVLLPLLMR